MVGLNMGYPLVIQYKDIDNGPFAVDYDLKCRFSLAMLVYQRVSPDMAILMEKMEGKNDF